MTLKSNTVKCKGSYEMRLWDRHESKIWDYFLILGLHVSGFTYSTAPCYIRADQHFYTPLEIFWHPRSPAVCQTNHSPPSVPTPNHSSPFFSTSNHCSLFHCSFLFIIVHNDQSLINTHFITSQSLITIIHYNNRRFMNITVMFAVTPYDIYTLSPHFWRLQAFKWTEINQGPITDTVISSDQSMITNLMNNHSHYLSHPHIFSHTRAVWHSNHSPDCKLMQASQHVWTKSVFWFVSVSMNVV